MKISTLLVIAVGVVACGGATDGTTASAETSALASDGGMPGGPKGPPPQAAIDACQNLSQGDACSFTTPECSVTGTCQGPEGKPLACAPDGPNGPSGSTGQNGPPPPPQAALDACQSSSQGADCSFTGKNGDSVSGTCGGPQGKPLACIPANGPPPPQN